MRGSNNSGSDDILFGRQPRSRLAWMEPITESDGKAVFCNRDSGEGDGGQTRIRFYTTEPFAATGDPDRTLAEIRERKLLHRLDSPAVVIEERLSEGGVRLTRLYYLNGRQHRADDHPAQVVDGPGDIHDELWFQDGVQHRDGSPAVIETGGASEREFQRMEVWRRRGEIHRDDGPAMTITFVNGGKHEAWFKDGQSHREDGPARVWTDPEGQVHQVEFAIDGTAMTRGEWEEHQRLEDSATG